MVSPDSEATKLCSPLAKQKICTESPTPGALQQHLFYGEYDPFKYAPIFESDFVQVTKKGEVLNIHNQVTVVTVGVTSTSPNFSLPNVMLLARPINDLRETECNCQVSTDRCPMELTRLFPLSFVNISIHDVYNHRLRLKLANGRAFYLQLYVHPECENEVFERWMKLVTLLHTNPEEVYGYEAVTPEIECILEQASAETSATELSEWQLEPPAMSPGMREYYEASHASSKRSDKSKKSKRSDKSRRSEKPEDCSERTQSKKSRKSGSSKMGESEGETGSIPDFSQEQEPWPPVEPPQKKKKTRGPIGFNFFKGDKGSKEKSPEEGQKLGPVSPPTPDYEEEPKTEWEEKGDRKRADEGTGRQKEKSKMDKGEKERKRQKDKEEKEREKIEKQKERDRQLKEKQERRQQERDNRKQKGKDKGTDKERRQREKEEKKQREQEDRKQRGMEDKKGKEKRSREKEDRKKQAKAKGEKDMNESAREVKGGKAV